MLIEILKRTPLWVFVLFFALFALGYAQTKVTVVTGRNVAMLPIAMMTLSFYGLLSAFGTAPIALAAWLIGAGADVCLGVVLAVPRDVSYSAETLSFAIPGSWFPLVLMTAIFFTKYAVGVILARQLPVAGTFEFIGLISFTYGFLSGLFLSRALVVWHSARREIETRSNPSLHTDVPLT